MAHFNPNPKKETCPKGHLKDAIRLVKEKRKSGEVYTREERWCRICHRAGIKRNLDGYRNVAISKQLYYQIQEEAESMGKTTRWYTQELLKRALG